MKRSVPVRAFIRTAVLSLCITTPLAAQTDALVAAQVEMLARRFDRAMTAADPRARAEMARFPPQPNHRAQRWTVGAIGTVNVRYWVYASVAEAERRFIAQSGLSVPTKPIVGLGDEAFLVAPFDPSGTRNMGFRRGRVIVEVDAPGEDYVRHFAALLLAEVDRTFAAGELEP